VKIILAHLGGSTPFLAARVAALSHYMGCPLTPHEIIEDFKSFYYETALSAHETTLTTMATFVPVDRLLFGSDFPGSWRSCAMHYTSMMTFFLLAVSTKTVEWYTENLKGYFADRPLDLANVMRNNALRLFPNLGKTKEERQSITGRSNASIANNCTTDNNAL
jgi:predicted TIM-barrel fold metal-dependent hydrolase